ncbi:MAG TPA: AAA family ATPase [Bacteroidales bacterium]|nr:AAA family ATPase [Bacteroidales bacterium]
MYELLNQSELLTSKVSLKFKRYLFDKINWNNRLIGIKGARGTGKTTMLLQWLNEQKSPANKAAYFTLDDLYFLTNTVVDTAAQFYREGGKILVLDEVHKYPQWGKEIKIIYDRYPDLQIIFTGSSIIDISRQEGDLSRRALMHELVGLSYREYLDFRDIIKMEPIDLKVIMDTEQKNKLSLPPDFRPLQHFGDYLKFGYYPFYTEDQEGYLQRLRQLTRFIVEYDMADQQGFDIRNGKKILQLLIIIAQQVPFKPNLVKLAEKTNIHRNSLANYLYFLDEARLLKLLYPAGKSIAALQKPEKIFLNNCNLLYALSSQEPSMGTLRETFALSHLSMAHHVTLPKTGDFLVDDKILLEIGGKAKTSKQLEGAPDAWVVRDDIEHVVSNAIPLWLLGFLY